MGTSTFGSGASCDASVSSISFDFMLLAIFPSEDWKSRSVPELAEVGFGGQFGKKADALGGNSQLRYKDNVTK